MDNLFRFSFNLFSKLLLNHCYLWRYEFSPAIFFKIKIFEKFNSWGIFNT